MSNTENTLEQDPLLPYYKLYYGDAIDRRGNLKKRKFYDEREWRYFPDEGSIELVNSNKKTLIEHKLKNYNLNLPKRLKFNLNYLEYIIINTPNDLKKLLPVLKSVSIKKKITYENFVSKILTTRQIRRDF